MVVINWLIQLAVSENLSLSDPSHLEHHWGKDLQCTLDLRGGILIEDLAATKILGSLQTFLHTMS